MYCKSHLAGSIKSSALAWLALGLLSLLVSHRNTKHFGPPAFLAVT